MDNRYYYSICNELEKDIYTCILEEDMLGNYAVTLHETYERTYEIQAHSPEEAEELLREKVQNGSENGPEECSDSWCDVNKL